MSLICGRFGLKFGSTLDQIENQFPNLEIHSKFIAILADKNLIQSHSSAVDWGNESSIT